MSTAVPEIYALPSLSDRVILNVTDALVCQYQGEHLPLLHYAKPLNELRFSTDPSRWTPCLCGNWRRRG
jgi:hypothetical protein